MPSMMPLFKSSDSRLETDGESLAAGGMGGDSDIMGGVCKDRTWSSSERYDHFSEFWVLGVGMSGRRESRGSSVPPSSYESGSPDGDFPDASFHFHSLAFALLFLEPPASSLSAQYPWGIHAYSNPLLAGRGGSMLVFSDSGDFFDCEPRGDSLTGGGGIWK